MAGAKQHNDPLVPNVDVLVEGIRTLLRAVDTVRQTGGKANLPPELVAACQDVVIAHEPPQGASRERISTVGSERSERSATRQRALQDPVRDIPLRRLLWQVLQPGETFSVGDVVQGLTAIGADFDASQVSNALGYWVDRDRLVRLRKGAYHLPLPSSTPQSPHPNADGLAPQVSAGAHDVGRSGQPGDRDNRRAQSQRGQEGRHGVTPAEESERRAG